MAFKRILLLLGLFTAAAFPVVLSYREEQEIRDVLTKLQTGSIRSELLSGAMLNYAIVVPADANGRFPLVLHIPGFGGNHMSAVKMYNPLMSIMTAEPSLRMIHVFLDPTIKYGDSFFVNSETNGPWAEALIKELIPYLEDRFPIDRDLRKHFLTGHSSGGWSAIWLQITSPDDFGGVWASSPDPVDFRSFFGVDLTPGSKENFYINADGKERSAARGISQTQRDYVQRVTKRDPLGNEWSAYEAAWSKKNQKGLPNKLFNRKTGELNPETLLDWQEFDIRSRIKRMNSEELRKIDGKLHLFCGANDTYFLDVPFISLCETLRQLPIKSGCQVVEERNHVDLYKSHSTYPKGLLYRFIEEMSFASR